MTCSFSAMGILLYFCIIGFLVNQANSYVLLQVSKDDQNRSNVDALIHKIVPSDQYDKIAAKLARKQIPSYPTRVGNNENTNSVYSKSDDKEKRLESRRGELEERKDDKDSDNLSNLVQNILSGLLKWKPILRTSALQIEPKEVNFRSSKPSLLYEVTANTFVEAITDILSSKSVNKYVEEIAKGAAAVYRTIKDPQ